MATHVKRVRSIMWRILHAGLQSSIGEFCHWILHLLARLTSLSEAALLWRLGAGESLPLVMSTERWSRDDGDDVCFALTIMRSVRMLGRRALAVTAPYAAVVASLSRRRRVMRRLLPHGLDVTTYDGWTCTPTQHLIYFIDMVFSLHIYHPLRSHQFYAKPAHKFGIGSYCHRRIEW